MYVFVANFDSLLTSCPFQDELKRQQELAQQKQQQQLAQQQRELAARQQAEQQRKLRQQKNLEAFQKSINSSTRGGEYIFILARLEQFVQDVFFRVSVVNNWMASDSRLKLNRGSSKPFLELCNGQMRVERKTKWDL